MITLISDRSICKTSLKIKIEELIHENRIDQVILREKDLSEKELFQLYLRIKELVKDTHINLIVNAPLSFAKKYGLSQIHLSQKNIREISSIEELENFSFGVSVHSKEEIDFALRFKPDYLMVSPVFKTSCKKGQQPLGIDFIRECQDRIDVPIIALGGINDRNIRQLKQLNITNIAMRSNLLL
jgi:thiamine-phosphate pyrophosphorylase